MGMLSNNCIDLTREGSESLNIEVSSPDLLNWPMIWAGVNRFEGLRSTTSGNPNRFIPTGSFLIMGSI